MEDSSKAKSRLVFVVFSVVSSLVSPLCSAADVATASGAPASGQVAINALRPSSITWGGYSHNEQLIGSESQWDFVQKYMDGFVMHGMYWNNKREYSGLVKEDVWLETVRSLGKCLQKYGKTAHIETGLGENEFDYKYDDPNKRGAAVTARNHVESMKIFLKEGVKVSKVRVDWFPLAAASVYAETFKKTSARELLSMVTGADKYWGVVPGFDPAKGNWREYARIVHDEFPDMEFGFDQAPCNFYKIEPDPAIRALVPWKGLGYGYLSQGLRTMYKKREIQVDGKPVPLSIDFADMMMSVALSTREAGIKFYGFEGDTPYVYVTKDLARMGKELMPFLLNIERLQHKYGVKNGKIINDCPKTPDKDGFTIDLGRQVEVDRAVIRWNVDFARKYKWEGSPDNQVWNTLVDVSEGSGGVDEKKFKKQTVRWIRCEFRVRGTAKGYSIDEVEVFGPANPGENLALKKDATANSLKPKKDHADMSTYEPKKGPAPELVDGNPNTRWESDYVSDDMWDKYFHDRTLEYLETYQSAGGRADQYIAESWYAGPYTLFPETKNGTFSNLAKDLIRRLRGINDDGTPMIVDLAMRVKGADKFTGEAVVEPASGLKQIIEINPRDGNIIVLEAQIRNDGKELNKGDARCLPLVRCEQAAVPSSGIICRDDKGQDITRQMSCTGEYDGWFAGGIEPKQTRTFSAELRPGANTPAEIKFELYWNAQDPSLKPRDVFTVKVNKK